MSSKESSGSKEKLIPLSKFSLITGIRKDKLRYWDKCGKLEPVKRTEGGYRYYSQDQVAEALNLAGKRVIVAYTLITRSDLEEIKKESDDFVEQVKSLEPDAVVIGIYEQWLGSVSKTKLEQILKDAQKGQVEKIYYHDKNWFIQGKWEVYKQFLSYMGTELVDFKEEVEKRDNKKV